MGTARVALTVALIAIPLAPWLAHAQPVRRSDPAPRVEAPPPARPARAPAPDADAVVNINTADVKTLMSLDGVGKRLAEKIVAYRESHGLFRSPEDIQKVDGVRGNVWEKNRARLAVR